MPSHRVCRRISHQIRDLRYSLTFTAILVTLFLICYQQNESVESNDVHTSPNGSGVQTSHKSLSKDGFHLVTAVSSREYEWLLGLIDSLVVHNGQFELLVWGLDLRTCEYEYLNKLTTPFHVHLHQFPFHFHALHLRQYHLTAIKPIILEMAALSFGQVLWIEPNNAANLALSLDHIMDVLNDKGGIAASISHPTREICAPFAIGVNIYVYRNFLKAWAECAKSQSCMTKELKDTKSRHGVDMLFEQRRKAKKMPCVMVETSETYGQSSGISTNWLRKKREICKPHSACVLTGSHRSHGCLTPQLARLRRNKEKYTSRHGYAYFEETYGFHRHAPCHRVWNKIHAILKHLDDCNILFWIDTDAVFTDMDKSLESFLDAYPGKEFLVSWPHADKMLNAGILWMRNTPSVREFFQSITNGKAWTQDWCVRDKFEQAAIRDELKRGALRGKSVVERSDTFLQTLCSFKNKECIVTEKDFIAHFAPPNCPHLHDLVKMFLDTYPQFTN